MTFKRIWAYILILLFNTMFTCVMWANDITISNVQVSEKSSPNQWLNINFDLSIDNSWRINTNSSNWNAAWVFIKYKISITIE